MARLCCGPAAIAVAVRPGGTLVTPATLMPQATTFPSLCRASPWNQPAATAVTLVAPLVRPAGTFVRPRTRLSPQATIVPFDLSASAPSEPAATAITLDRPLGTNTFVK